MRNNGGGNSAVGDVLYAYLSDKPYTEGRMYIKTSKEIKDWYRSERQGHPLYDLVINGQDNELVLYPDTVKTIPEKVHYPFKVNVFLLISRKTYSSGHMFAGLFKCNDIGVMIGQETGQATKTVGDAYSFKLPNSGFDISVSYKIFESMCELSYFHGFQPHYTVEYTPEELSSGIDKELIFTQNLIDQRKLSSAE